mgnify:CR=1 FL=1
MGPYLSGRNLGYVYPMVLPFYSTVTDLARFLGWSMFLPRATAMWYASNCSGIADNIGERRYVVVGIYITSSAI